jgi:hypothetical protein
LETSGFTDWVDNLSYQISNARYVFGETKVKHS